jgi:hypothetical protein
MLLDIQSTAHIDDTRHPSLFPGLHKLIKLGTARPGQGGIAEVVFAITYQSDNSLFLNISIYACDTFYSPALRS